MPKTCCLYLDDSGTRNPDHTPDPQQLYRDWFSLGGIILFEEDESEVRAAHATFCEKWNIDYPLRAYDIRAKTRRFSWIATLSDADQEVFHDELYQMLTSIPVIGHACVIDRPGYDARYRKKYGRQTWMLCKTAFSVLCERAAKLAALSERKLRVMPEAGDKTSDNHVREYYESLRSDGMPFQDATSAKYAPMSASELSKTLYELRFKKKSSPMAQLADLYLYPIARGGYAPDYRPYRALREHKMLIDDHLDDDGRPHLGIKYSCFELVEASKNTDAGVSPGNGAAPVTGTS